MSELRALTVRQPWAHLITYCGKTVENRSRATKYRGLLAIHAGSQARWDWDATWQDVVRDAWPWREIPAIDPDERRIDFGAIIAVTELYGCHQWPDAGSCNGRGRPPCSPWAAADQWHWQLRDVRPLPRPVPARGWLGLWIPTPETERAVMEQLEVSRA